jgi:hypothetical protein
MPLTQQEIANEGIKLGASFLNTLGAALITTGSVSPIASEPSARSIRISR